MPKRLTLALSVLLAVVFLLVGLLLFGPSETPQEPWEGPARPVSAEPVSSKPAPRPPEPIDSHEQTVSLSLSLDLIERANAGDGEPALIGKTSALSGLVLDGWGGPIEGAKLSFSVGLNQGMRTESGPGGRYEFFSLFPGTHQLRIEARLGTVLREIRLRDDAQESMDFPFGATSTLSGQVVDRKGKPIEGAKIEVDERVCYSAPDGTFLLSGVFPGEAVIYASGENYGYFRQNLAIPPNYQFEPGRLQIVLGPGGTLRGGAYPFGGQEPVLLFLVPGMSSAHRSIPYEKFAGIEVAPGGGFAIPNVPADTSLVLLAYHTRSAAKPVSRPVLLRDGRSENIVKIDFRFDQLRLLQGEVRSAGTGDPIHRARVRLYAKNPYAAVSQVLRLAGPGMGGFLVPMLPFCHKEVFTDSAGKFALESGDGSVRSEPMILLIDAPGHLPFEKAIAGEAPVNLPVVLYSRESLGESASLRLQLRGGVPASVTTTLQGVPKAVRSLGADETYSVEDLSPGIYRIELRRGEEILLREARLAIVGSKEVEVWLRR